MPQYPLAAVGTEHINSHLQISFRPFLICYSLVVLTLDAVQPDLLMALLNKPQTNEIQIFNILCRQIEPYY